MVAYTNSFTLEAALLRRVLVLTAVLLLQLLLLQLVVDFLESFAEAATLLAPEHFAAEASARLQQLFHLLNVIVHTVASLARFLVIGANVRNEQVVAWVALDAAVVLRIQVDIQVI